MLTSGERRLLAAGLDGLALKPTEVDVERARGLDVEHLVVDWEGPDAVPDPDALAGLAADAAVRLTTPVRADGFDPLGDDGRTDRVPDGVGRVLVAGHGAYLDDEEAGRAIAPRLGAAAAADPGAWVGTESVERAALATGNPQFELLGRTTARDLRALRAAGFDGTVAVYAPVVVSADDDVVLDALGEYVARRGPVRSALPDGAATDGAATGRAREVLTSAAEDFALVGDADAVAAGADELRAAGADLVVGYPARGL